jgi:hypothetical protein
MAVSISNWTWTINIKFTEVAIIMGHITMIHKHYNISLFSQSIMVIIMDHFTIFTNIMVIIMDPLTWLNKMKDKNQRLLRWALALQTYTFEVKYRKGSQNGNADGLSRFC